MSLDYPQTQPLPKVSKPKPSKSSTKCSWCDRKRARNDLCNVCRQKVESRARRLMEQKLEGDMDVIQKVMRYFEVNIPCHQMSGDQIQSLILESFPYLMLKFQSENTYRGKKGNRCWCLPESVLKKLISQFFPKDSASAAIIAKGGRQELCNLLMRSVATSFGKYGVTEMKSTATEDGDASAGSIDRDVTMADGKSMKKEALCFPSPSSLTAMHPSNYAEDPSNHSLSALGANPPRKRQRTAMSIGSDYTTNHNGGSTVIANRSVYDLQPRHQIWGRSDTNLLSFDIKRCQEFLNKFKQDVLCGTELDQMEPDQRVGFLKKRCHEFVKMLQELRDYVIHLRSSNELTVATSKQEVARLGQQINDLLANNRDSGLRETLMRCTATLLSKLAPSPVDTQLLRANMDKLEQYHTIACNELTEAIHKFESIGARLGLQRPSDMTLIQYATHLQQSMISRRSSHRKHGLSENRNIESLYINTMRPDSGQQPVTTTTTMTTMTTSSFPPNTRNTVTMNTTNSRKSNGSQQLPPNCNGTPPLNGNRTLSMNQLERNTSVTPMTMFPINPIHSVSNSSGTGSSASSSASSHGGGTGTVGPLPMFRQQPINTVQCRQSMQSLQSLQSVQSMQGQKPLVFPQIVNALPPIPSLPGQHGTPQPVSSVSIQRPQQIRAGGNAQNVQNQQMLQFPVMTTGNGGALNLSVDALSKLSALDTFAVDEYRKMGCHCDLGVLCCHETESDTTDSVPHRPYNVI